MASDQTSDRVCTCAQYCTNHGLKMRTPHPPHFMCECGQPGSCPKEACYGDPYLHEGQPGYAEAKARSDAGFKRVMRRARWRGRGGLVRDLWQTVIGMGMYSQDPNINRPAMLITGQRLLRDSQALAEQHRIEDALAEEARMRRQAEMNAEAMLTAMERRMAQGQGG